MGLDISSGSYGFRAGSYSGFHSFRNWLAVKLGYTDLNDYCDDVIMRNPKLREWNNRAGVPKDARSVPLGPLLLHSDCDGYITAINAKALIKPLKEIRDALEPESAGELQEDEAYFRESLDHWIVACEEAADGGRIDFG